MKMVKEKLKFYKYDEDLLSCDCSACENIRNSYAKIHTRRKITCREILVKYLRKYF